MQAVDPTIPAPCKGCKLKMKGTCCFRGSTSLGSIQSAAPRLQAPRYRPMGRHAATTPAAGQPEGLSEAVMHRINRTRGGQGPGCPIVILGPFGKASVWGLATTFPLRLKRTLRPSWSACLRT